MSLTVIYGPMGAGKSKESQRLKSILEQVHHYKSLVIVPETNTRDDNNVLKTHDQLEFPYDVKVKDLRTIDCTLIQQANVLVLEEFHFFTVNTVNNTNDLDVTLNNANFYMIEHWYRVTKKHVIVVGLKADYNKQKFGKTLDLLPICTESIPLYAYCPFCEDMVRAPHTRKFLDLSKTTQVQVGGMETYKPVCDKHYDMPFDDIAKIMKNGKKVL